METINQIAARPATAVLSRMSHVNLRFAMHHQNEDVLALHAFLGLQSVKKIEVRNVGTHQDDNTTDIVEYMDKPLVSGPSKVLDLSFSECAISTTTIFEILAQCEALQSFTYERARIAFNDNVNPFWLRHALLAHTRHCLCSLTLLPPSKGAFMGSLRKFDVLKKLRVNFSCLFGLVECKHRQFADVLPASIEEVELRLTQDQWPRMLALSQELFKVKESRLPRLKIISLEWEPPSGTLGSLPEELLWQCNSHGLCLVVKQDSQSQHL